MKLKDFIENLQEMVKENPKLLEFNVIAAKDAEGNGYEDVYYAPTLGVYDADGEFFTEDYYEDYELSSKDENAICIN